MATRIELRAADIGNGALNQPSTPPALRPRRDRSNAAMRGTFQPMRFRWYLACKVVMDRVLALTLLLLAGPVILLCAALVKMTSRGPAFYTQRRVGLNGRHFTIIKLRTMINKAESLTGPRWSMPGDPRVTRIGAFLRTTHLDELPQLLNVLRGDMSLIGPRPERPEFLPELEKALPGYRKRLTVRPGVTGLAQVQLPADTDVEGVGRKLAYDLFYIQHLNPWLDFRLLISTGFYALGVPFEKIGRLFRIPKPDEVERLMFAHIHEASARVARRSA